MSEVFKESSVKFRDSERLRMRKRDHIVFTTPQKDYKRRECAREVEELN